METIKKSIEIKASDDTVWNTLTNPQFINKWAAAFEAGTTVVSDWQEGSVVTWKNGEGKNLVKGRVEVSYAPKMLKVRYFDDENAADDAKFGAYEEHYLLTEHEGMTLFSVESGPMDEKYIKDMDPQWDEAIKLIRQLSEAQ